MRYIAKCGMDLAGVGRVEAGGDVPPEAVERAGWLVDKGYVQAVEEDEPRPRGRGRLHVLPAGDAGSDWKDDMAGPASTDVPTSHGVGEGVS
jgi:hypothetical protein